MATVEEAAMLSDDIYKGLAKEDNVGTREIKDTKWVLLKDTFEYSPNTGFQAGVYEKRDKDGNVLERVVAYAGSDQLDDWVNDIELTVGVAVPQGEQALRYYDRHITKHNLSVSAVVGHSLGQALAIITSHARDVQGMGFNGPGMDSTKYIEPNTGEIKEIKADQGLWERFTEYLTKGDWISESGGHVGQANWYEPVSDYNKILEAAKEAIKKGEEISASALTSIGDLHSINQWLDPSRYENGNVIDAPVEHAGDSSYTPPQGMPDENGKGEYPDAGTSPVKPPMPDYTPSTNPNNPPDKPSDKPYTPPPGMPNSDPNDPNKPKEPILPNPPSKKPFRPPYPWDKDLPPDPPVDPLALDLDGNGIETVAISKDRYFDGDGDGFSSGTGWINSHDGLLALDRNGDGIINDGTELFGDQTVLQNGQKAKNGFEVLKDFDKNNDGRIDKYDDVWKDLRVWVDTDGDGVTDSGELHTLDEFDIKKLFTDSKQTNITDAAGNTQNAAGSYETTDGSIKEMNNYLFESSLINSRYDNKVEVSEEVAKCAYLQGRGNAMDVWQTMMKDETGELQKLMEQFACQTYAA